MWLCINWEVAWETVFFCLIYLVTKDTEVKVVKPVHTQLATHSLPYVCGRSRTVAWSRLRTGGGHGWEQEPVAIFSLPFLIWAISVYPSFLSFSPLPLPHISFSLLFFSLPSLYLQKRMRLGSQPPADLEILREVWKAGEAWKLPCNYLWRRLCKVIKGATDPQYLSSIIFPFLSDFRL